MMERLQLNYGMYQEIKSFQDAGQLLEMELMELSFVLVQKTQNTLAKWLIGSRALLKKKKYLPHFV